MLCKIARLKADKACMALSVACKVSLVPMWDDTECNAKRSALHRNLRTVRRLRRQCAISFVNSKLQTVQARPGMESDPLLLAHLAQVKSLELTPIGNGTGGQESQLPVDVEELEPCTQGEDFQMGFANASFEMRGVATLYIGEEEAGREEETPHLAPTWEPPAMYDMQDVIFRLQCLQEEFLDASGKDQMRWNNAEANPGMAPEFLEVGLSARAVISNVNVCHPGQCDGAG